MKKNAICKIEGENLLRTMGASWFVSYMWYEKIDNEHKNWQYVPTTELRINTYKRGVKYHKTWLAYIVDNVSETNLSKNEIKISGDVIKEMAEVLYSQCY